MGAITNDPAIDGMEPLAAERRPPLAFTPPKRKPPWMNS
nr:phage protease [Pseudomonas aeruginosa]